LKVKDNSTVNSKALEIMSLISTDVLYHAFLDWEGVLVIDDVWFKIKVDRQFRMKAVNCSPSP